MLRRVKTCGKLVVGFVFVSSLTALFVQRRAVDLSDRRLYEKVIKAPATSSKHSQSPTKADNIPSVDPETATLHLSRSSTSNISWKRVDGDGLRTSSWQQAELRPEGDIAGVLAKLDTCLSAANLTDYFLQNGLLSKARRNAEHFLTTLRQSIPSVFNSSYSSPCWENSLDMRLCTASSQPACSGSVISGSLGTVKYRKFTSVIEGSLSKALNSNYPNGVSSSVVCLPKVFLAGFPKCGSSYLYCLFEQLSSTHRIDSLVKEPHFWVPRGPFGQGSIHQFPHDRTEIVPYLLNFLPAVQSELDSGFSAPIDGSPNLLFQWRPYRRNEGIVNYCLTPAVLPQVLPDSKFIVVMRNPVDMLYSAYWFSCSDLNIELSRDQQKRMPDEFHKKVLIKIQIFESCLRSAPIDKCMMDVFKKLDDSFKYCGRIRMEIGFYYLYIRKWLAVISREQFMFLTTEELETERESVEERILDFVDGRRAGVGHRRTSDGVRFTRGSTFCDNIQTRYDYHHNPELRMKGDTRTILSAFYKPYNRKLATLLHDDKYLWDG